MTESQTYPHLGFYPGAVVVTPDDETVSVSAWQPDPLFVRVENGDGEEDYWYPRELVVAARQVVGAESPTGTVTHELKSILALFGLPDAVPGDGAALEAVREVLGQNARLLNSFHKAVDCE